MNWIYVSVVFLSFDSLRISTSSRQLTDVNVSRSSISASGCCLRLYHMDHSDTFQNSISFNIFYCYPGGCIQLYIRSCCVNSTKFRSSMFVGALSDVKFRDYLPSNISWNISWNISEIFQKFHDVVEQRTTSIKIYQTQTNKSEDIPTVLVVFNRFYYNAPQKSLHRVS